MFVSHLAVTWRRQLFVKHALTLQTFGEGPRLDWRSILLHYNICDITTGAVQFFLASFHWFQHDCSSNCQCMLRRTHISLESNRNVTLSQLCMQCLAMLWYEMCAALCRFGRLTPAQKFRSWHHLYCTISEKQIRFHKDAKNAANNVFFHGESPADLRDVKWDNLVMSRASACNTRQ